jgi:putative ABC transport system permease protein
MLRFAWKNLLSRPVRSLLALCGLTVSIAGMVGLFSVAEGIEDSVAATFGKVPGLTIMQPGAPIPLFSRLPSAWGGELRGIAGVHVVHPEVWSRAHVIEGKPTISPPRFLFGSDLIEADRLRYSVYREGIKSGRALSSVDRGTRHALISRAIADEFKKEAGDTLRVDGREFKIVGIYEAQSLFLDVAIILDIDEVRRMARIGSDSVSNFYVEPERDADRQGITTAIKTLFRGRTPEAWQPTLAAASELTGEPAAPKPLAALWKSLGESLQKPSRAEPEIAGAGANANLSLSEASENGAPGPTANSSADSPGQSARSATAEGGAPGDNPTGTGELPVEVRSPDDWAGEFKRFTADLDLFLLLMTGIGVTIAFVGIVNTMLMSVTERYIEFGVLKANGWSNGDVLRLIACESALLGFTGGVAGSFIGWIATLVINARWPTRIHLFASPELLLFSLCFSTVLGVLGGLYPALRASRMMPMDAIRRG